ncbi:hypothetical protein [Chondromyces crocatus]|uniref:DUF3352 domain-containing protein n=1 Tax=Chondromyces crocatus TaxID=52 RepID=A0A0K1EDN8_CHOCO|nr:hypothetical protein [Chondromyces crocatus]AKT38678.1 uncharacterized protein CMC5_028260 [Chondromyces crocatus]
MKQRGWLLAFVLLLGIAAFLMARADSPRAPARAVRMAFPRHPTLRDHERRARRQSLPPVALPGDTEAAPQRRDPLTVALPTDPDKSAFVFELEDLKDSPLGQIWMDCLLERTDRGRDRFKDVFGIDLLEDVERVAVSTGRVAILGLVPDAERTPPPRATARPYGERAQIYTSDDRGEIFATWGDSLLLTGPERSAIEAALDRLDGKGPLEEPRIPDWSAYGAMYGVLSPEDAANLFPPSRAELAAQLQAVVSRVDIHVDAAEDVAMVLDVSGPQADDLADLARSLGGALTLARATSTEEGDHPLARLLEHAAVHPKDDRFAVDLALPLDLLKTMGPCRKREPRPQEARPGDPSPAPEDTPADE